MITCCRLWCAHCKQHEVWVIGKTEPKDLDKFVPQYVQSDFYRISDELNQEFIPAGIVIFICAKCDRPARDLIYFLEELSQKADAAGNSDKEESDAKTG